jgi:opacity protein-like surface antigen
MKSFLLGSAALIMLAGAANAADMPVKAMPVKAPQPVSYD